MIFFFQIHFLLNSILLILSKFILPNTLQLLPNLFQQRLFQIFSTLLKFIAGSLANWYKIWLWQHNKGCGKYHAGNLPQLKPYLVFLEATSSELDFVANKQAEQYICFNYCDLYVCCLSLLRAKKHFHLNTGYSNLYFYHIRCPHEVFAIK